MVGTQHNRRKWWAAAGRTKLWAAAKASGGEYNVEDYEWESCDYVDKLRVKTVHFESSSRGTTEECNDGDKDLNAGDSDGGYVESSPPQPPLVLRCHPRTIPYAALSTIIPSFNLAREIVRV